MDVREALHAKVLLAHRDDPHTLVVDELGLCEGEARVDIAVVNGFIHGFEIKSERDTLERLPHQVEVYSLVLDRVTLVVAENHAAHAMEVIPDWWGVKVARQGKRRAIHFQQVRRPRLNREIDPLELVQLLWRDEAVSALAERNLLRGVKSKPKQVVFERLVSVLELDEIRALVRKTLKHRTGWRQ